jgi:hypothetical protein
MKARSLRSTGPLRCRCWTGTVACCGPRPRPCSRTSVAACDSRVSAPELEPSLSFLICLAAGQSASAHPVEHEPNHNGVVLLKQANGVLPEASAFGPSPARQGSAPPLRALDRLLPTQEPASIEEDAPTGSDVPTSQTSCVAISSQERLVRVRQEAPAINNHRRIFDVSQVSRFRT